MIVVNENADMMAVLGRLAKHTNDRLWTQWLWKTVLETAIMESREQLLRDLG